MKMFDGELFPLRLSSEVGAAWRQEPAKKSDHGGRGHHGL